MRALRPALACAHALRALPSAHALTHAPLCTRQPLPRCARAMAYQADTSLCQLSSLGVGPLPDATGQQTMLRVSDPLKSLAFYRDVLGLTLVDQARVVRRSERWMRRNALTLVHLSV